MAGPYKHSSSLSYNFIAIILIGDSPAQIPLSPLFNVLKRQVLEKSGSKSQRTFRLTRRKQ